MSKTDRHWNKWAEQDPYHGVLGLGFDKNVIGDTNVKDLFWAQGESHIATVMDDAAKLGSSGNGSALDFGCGVGRLLRPLLTRFDKVSGVDIAPAMLTLAAENCPEVNKLTLATSLDDPKLPDNSYDLVHSYIVLQHIRPAQGIPIIQRLIAKAKPGGTVALHFTVGDLNKRRRLMNRMRYRLPPLHWAYNVTTGRAWDLPISEMNVYPIAEILALFRKSLHLPFVTRAFDQNGHQGLMIVGRKA